MRSGSPAERRQSVLHEERIEMVSVLAKYWFEKNQRPKAVAA